jgi:hypothetical protein
VYIVGEWDLGYLILCLSLEEDDIDYGEFLDISMSFEFLTDSRADCRHRNDKAIRLHDFRGLSNTISIVHQLSGVLQRAAIVGRGR